MPPEQQNNQSQQPPQSGGNSAPPQFDPTVLKMPDEAFVKPAEPKKKTSSHTALYLLLSILGVILFISGIIFASFQFGILHFHSGGIIPLEFGTHDEETESVTPSQTSTDDTSSEAAPPPARRESPGIIINRTGERSTSSSRTIATSSNNTATTSTEADTTSEDTTGQ